VSDFLRLQIEARLAGLEAERRVLREALDRLGSPPSSDRRPFAERQKQARDWILQQEAPFAKNELARAIGLAENSSTAHRLIESFLRTKMIEEVGMRQGGRGRPALLYRYASQRTEPRIRRIGHGASPTSSSGGVAVSAPVRHPNKEFQKALTPAIRAGAVLTKTGGGHFRLKAEGKDPVVIPGTSSDHRALKNLKATLRRFRYPVS
jgi:hypothetical protein